MQETDIVTHVVAVTAIVRKGNKYLLAKRSFNDPQQGGKWSFPGGKVDAEIEEGIIEKTLKREIKEEVGIEIKDEVKLIYNNSFTRVSGHHVVMLVFMCDYESGEAQALEGQEEIRWVTMKELGEMKNELPDYTWDKIAALQKFLKLI